MANRKVIESLSGINSLSIALEQIGTLATAVLREHAAEAGRCVVCQSAWPCESVVLAEHNLAMV